MNEWTMSIYVITREEEEDATFIRLNTDIVSTSVKTGADSNCHHLQFVYSWCVEKKKRSCIKWTIHYTSCWCCNYASKHTHTHTHNGREGYDYHHHHHHRRRRRQWAKLSCSRGKRKKQSWFLLFFLLLLLHLLLLPSECKRDIKGTCVCVFYNHLRVEVDGMRRHHDDREQFHKRERNSSLSLARSLCCCCCYD